jgi:glutathione peroxidase
MSIYDLPINFINNKSNVMDVVRGKVCLMVNIASKHGYQAKCSPVWSFARTAKQLWELQQVHEEFFDKGFSVVGFPCNQFGKMEPSENEEIAKFVEDNYPFVSFPITEKINVNGESEHPIYTLLKGPLLRRNDDNMADMSNNAIDGQNKAMQAMSRVPHNWEKFLVSREGFQVGRFNWAESPLADEPIAMGAGWTIREAIGELI